MNKETKLGTLFGVDIVIKTDDPDIVKHATAYLEKYCGNRMPTDEELSAEVDRVLGIKRI